MILICSRMCFKTSVEPANQHPDMHFCKLTTRREVNALRRVYHRRQHTSHPSVQLPTAYDIWRQRLHGLSLFMGRGFYGSCLMNLSKDC